MRTIPDRKTTVGSEEDVEWCRKYWRNTMAKRGPVEPNKVNGVEGNVEGKYLQ